MPDAVQMPCPHTHLPMVWINLGKPKATFRGDLSLVGLEQATSDQLALVNFLT